MTQPSRQHLEEFDSHFRNALLAFFLRRVRNADEAEDMTQEVFIRLVSSDDRQIESRQSYVFAIAANLLRDKARREKVRADYRDAKRIEDYVGIDPLDPFRIVASRETLSGISNVIERLPEKTRRIFTLYRFENVDKATIAARFSLSKRMIEIHIQRAMVAIYEQADIDP